MPRALGWVALPHFLERVRGRSFLIAALEMLLVAAVAVLFECVPLLKGGLGSVAYFALYLYAVAGLTVGNSVYERKPDPLGVGFALREMSLAGSGTAGGRAHPPTHNRGKNPPPNNPPLPF